MLEDKNKVEKIARAMKRMAKRSDGATRDSLRQEYEVYNSVIDPIVNSWVAADEMKLIVIAEHTKVERGLEQGLPILMIDRDLRADFDYELDQSAVDDFAKSNNRDCNLRGSWFHLNCKCVIITSEEEKEIFDKGLRGWDYFYEFYPDSQGILRLSRVGFNDKSNQAIVYLENEAWWLAGTGLYVFLTKNKDGKWRIKNEMLAWMS